jgi:hypothetical protein
MIQFRYILIKNPVGFPFVAICREGPADPKKRARNPFNLAGVRRRESTKNLRTVPSNFPPCPLSPPLLPKACSAGRNSAFLPKPPKIINEIRIRKKEKEKTDDPAEVCQTFSSAFHPRRPPPAFILIFFLFENFDGIALTAGRAFFDGIALTARCVFFNVNRGRLLIVR